MNEALDRFDWGERSSRWIGVTSEVVDVQGMRAHFLRANADLSAPDDAPTHLLVHPMGTGAWSWLDVIGPLALHGAVVAPDLPGSGQTRPRHRGAVRAEDSARFLRDFTSTLRVDRLVVHGHSMGGLVAVLFADLSTERVKGLVLVDPSLPGAAGASVGTLPGRTAGRLALSAAQPLARPLMRIALHFKAATPQRLADSLDLVGTDVSRISPALLTVVAEEVERLRISWRSDAAVTALASAIRDMTFDARAVGAAIDRILAPTLLLWGERDRVITRELIDQLIAQRPDWDLHVLEAVGHMAPWEAPAAYVAAVGEWLKQTRTRSRDP